jgi:citrate lyase synthetase
MKPAPQPAIDPKLLEDPVFRRVMADALAIQHRFAAEPVYAKTGKGYLKSEGVEELQRIKARKHSEGKR